MDLVRVYGGRNFGVLKRTGKIDVPELLPFYLQVAINYRESIS